MTVSNRELAMTLANEICSRLGRGRHKTLTATEFDELISNCRTLKSLVGDDFDYTVADLIECVRELKDDADNSDLLNEALDRANGAKTLAYEIRQGP